MRKLIMAAAVLVGVTAPAAATDPLCTLTPNLSVHLCPSGSTDWYTSYTDLVNGLDALAKTTRSSFTVTGAGGLLVSYGLTASTLTATTSLTVPGGAVITSTGATVGGKLGINAVPSQTLTINDPSTMLIQMRRAASDIGYLGSASALFNGTAVTDLGLFGQNNLFLGAGSNYSLGIDGSGHVTVPNSLTVAGSSASVQGNMGVGMTATGSGVFQIGDTPTDDSTAYLRFLKSNTNKNWQIAANHFLAGGLEFVPSTTGGGNSFTTPAMVITNGGNIGIGTTSPATKLHMSSGTLTVDGTGAAMNIAGSTFTVANSGIISAPSQPRAGVSRLTTQNITGSAYTAVFFGTENYDKQDLFNVAGDSSVFTVPAGGGGNYTATYVIDVPLGGTGATTAKILINGATSCPSGGWAQIAESASQAQSFSVTCDAELSAGDTVSVWVREASGSDQSICGNTGCYGSIRKND